MKCPKCGSEDTTKEKYQDVTIIICSKCGFDERSELDITYEQKNSQREKTRYSIYKAGR